MTDRPPNRLAGAGSAYLRSAAHQPIRWHPWGPEAFAEARAAGKPVLLDIGAVWCHWCHVMDRESYEDPALAADLDARFVCIKVDRDERPDVDARYQRAVQIMAGQGGWPLTAFLTPDGEVFFGGTYFPPDDRYGRPGFRTVLNQVHHLWRDRRAEASAQAGAVRQAVERVSQPAPGPGVGPATLLAAEREILGAYDPAFGGFGHAPKFPHPTALRFLMTRWSGHRSAETRLVAIETLRAMARGGIHDQLGGGFHRYSVDRGWIIPHFEKMSSDNAELLRAYAEAAALFGEEEFAEVARGILRWVREVLALPQGGYGTSQDADVGPDDDGSYFTWTQDEVAACLGPDDLALALHRFGLGTAGRMPHDPARNVLFQAAPLDQLARDTGRPVAEVDARLQRIGTALRAARARRRAPAVDPTPYTSWNGLMAGASLRAAAVLDDVWAAEHALATLGRLRREAPAPDRMAHRPQADAPSLLEDQVFTADAAIEAFETTADPSWLRWAETLMDRAWRDHWDERLGGLTDRARDAGAEGLLDSRVIPVEDAPAPSGNGMAAVTCARLAAHLPEGPWGDRHRALVQRLAVTPRLGLQAGAWLLAADWWLHPPALLVVTGPPGDPVALALHREALRSPLPRRVVRREQRPGEPARGSLCVGARCLAPADGLEGWRAQLAEANRADPG